MIPIILAPYMVGGARDDSGISNWTSLRTHLESHESDIRVVRVGRYRAIRDLRVALCLPTQLSNRIHQNRIKLIVNPESIFVVD